MGIQSQKNKRINVVRDSETVITIPGERIRDSLIYTANGIAGVGVKENDVTVFNICIEDPNGTVKKMQIPHTAIEAVIIYKNRDEFGG